MRAALSIPLIAALGFAGCRPALLEERNFLEDQVTFLRGEVDSSNDRVLELQRELDTCQQDTDLRAVRQILDEVGVNADEPLQAVLHTSRGDIRVELLPRHAPRTVANFVGLAEGTRPWTHPRTGTPQEGTPLYRDLLFHRVLEAYVIQTGDPLGDGTGKPGYAIPDEFHDDIWYGEAGMLGMANSGPDTNGSQFFITLGEARHLNNKHTLFGKVVEGMDVVTEISVVPVGRLVEYRPNRDVTLRSIEIIRP